MGLLDEAIREHLELKRRRGADGAEVSRQEKEAFGPPVQQAPAVAEAPADPAQEHRPALDEPGSFAADAPPEPPTRLHVADVPAEPDAPEAPAELHGHDLELESDPPRPHGDPADRFPHAEPEGAAPVEPAEPSQPTREFDLDEVRAATDAEPEIVPADEEPEGEDVLEETPEFLQETPEHDRLWFEQRPPATSISEHRLTWLDVFTSQPLGNGLAVVHDADELDEETMLRFARETRLSETCFVQSAEADGADYRNRIWMPSREVPFAGHPSLGTAVAVARARGETRARYVQQTHAGLQPIEVQLDGRTGRASMLQEPPVHGAELPPARVLGAIGLAASDAAPELPIQVVSTGAWQIIAPVASDEALARCRPDGLALAELIREHDALTVYAVVCEPAAGVARARAFFDDVGGGVIEDPATGSAAGPLMAYLHARTGVRELTIDQGVQMGRASRLDAAIVDDRVSIAGDAVIVAEGTLAV